MAELNITFRVKKTIWFYLVKLSCILHTSWLLKVLDGKPLANLYIGKKLQTSIKFNLSEYTKVD